MQRSTLLSAVFIAGLVSLSASTSQAQWGYYGGVYSGGSYGFAISERPPYFALHPPVYYRHPVAQTYGSSPWARPSQAASEQPWSSRSIVWRAAESQVKPPQPLLIQNPYVTASKPKK